ncbi:NADH-quinone oxidoreductase subunit C [Chloroflexota bacterium]
MTVSLSGNKVAEQIAKHFPETIFEIIDDTILIKRGSITDIMEYLKSSPEYVFDYLNHITAVDYYQYFELVYQLTSIKHNHSLVIKTRCYGRENISVPSIVGLYRSADYQEREIYDLLGISFAGHPNLKRIALWEGFEGYPLRKDYL